MPNESDKRMHRVEANLDRFAAVIIETAERQSTTEHHLDQLTLKVDRLSDKVDRLSDKVGRLSDTVGTMVAAITADGENIRALARIAEAH